MLGAWDVREVHTEWVAAPPERAWAALQAVTAGELPVTRALMAVRGLGAAAPRDRPLLDGLREMGLRPLLVEPRAEVLGMIARPWRALERPHPFSGAAEFAAFAEPGWVRIAMANEAQDAGLGTLLRTETQVQATDAGARRALAVYWTLVRAGSGRIRRELLGAARAEAG